MGKMKKYASFNDYLKDQNPKNQAVIGALRRFVKRVEPKLKESRLAADVKPLDLRTNIDVTQDSVHKIRVRF